MQKTIFDKFSFLENRTLKQEIISILSVPLDLGSQNSGMDLAPKHLLKVGLKPALESAGFTAKVLLELESLKQKSGTIKKKNDVGEISKTLGYASRAVKREILAGNRVLCIGGDHSISIGTVGGAAEALRGDLGIIWVDAHADLNTHASSTSGNVHGMSTAALLGLGDSRLTSLVKKKIKKENILYIGLKDLDNAEIDFIRKYKLSAITMMDIFEGGFSILGKYIKSLFKRVPNTWISLDLDAVDEQYAPAASLASAGGFSYREAISLMTYISRQTNVIGMDIVELIPEKDLHQKTARLAIELAAAAFGSKYNWYSEYMRAQNKQWE